MRSKMALTLDDARTILAAARSEADKQRWNVTVAVVDDAGKLLMLERMDGARAQTAEVATLKASSAAITHRPGRVWEESAKSRPGTLNFPSALHITGGVPIVHKGEVIGAVGVSGVQSHEDEQVALAGIAALIP
jgi:glc operon protein GlcG